MLSPQPSQRPASRPQGLALTYRQQREGAAKLSADTSTAYLPELGPAPVRVTPESLGTKVHNKVHDPHTPQRPPALLATGAQRLPNEG
ncbi:hypothetical protein P7K49_018631, partial [Saguinus oedipus]